MGKLDEALAEMGRMLDAPDPLEAATRAAERAGGWAHWSVARQLWYLRRVSGLSQTELAWRAGLSREEICRLEGGADARWSTIERFLGALGYYPLIVPERLARRKSERRRLSARQRRRYARLAREMTGAPPERVEESSRE